MRTLEGLSSRSGLPYRSSFHAPVQNHVEGRGVARGRGDDQESLPVRGDIPADGPVRMPVSTMSVSNRGCGVPAWKVGVVVHTKIFGARSVCRREKRNRSSRRQGELLPDNSERRFSCRRGAGAAAPVRPGSLPGRASPVREQRAFPPATRTRRRGHRCRRSRLLRGSSGRHTC